MYLHYSLLLSLFYKVMPSLVAGETKMYEKKHFFGLIQNPHTRQESALRHSKAVVWLAKRVWRHGTVARWLAASDMTAKEGHVLIGYTKYDVTDEAFIPNIFQGRDYYYYYYHYYYYKRPICSQMAANFPCCYFSPCLSPLPTYWF